MRVTINIVHLSVTKIITISIIILLCLLIILLAYFLILISNYKNKQFNVFKNLQYIQSLSIKERLIRIKQMVVSNDQYTSMLGI